MTRNDDYSGEPADDSALLMTALEKGFTQEALRECLEYVVNTRRDSIDGDTGAHFRLLDLAFRGLLHERGMI